MIDLLVYVLVVLLVFGAIWYIITLLPLPPPFGQIAQIIVAVIFIIILLYLLLGVAGHAPKLSLR